MRHSLTRSPWASKSSQTVRQSSCLSAGPESLKAPPLSTALASLLNFATASGIFAASMYSSFT
eukprot:10259510-Lingulodinium_polyedra.AAC.1